MPGPTKPHSTPAYLVKLYRKYTDAKDNFALGIYVANSTDAWFTFAGVDAAPLQDPKQEDKPQPFNYERLEIYADGTDNLTFAIPVLITNDLANDFINPGFTSRVTAPGQPKAPRHLKLKCHMLLLVGEKQGSAGGITTTGVVLNLYRSDARGKMDTVLEPGDVFNESQIGDTHFGTDPERHFGTPIALSQLPAWLAREGPWKDAGPISEKFKGKQSSPGPLLQQAISDFGDLEKQDDHTAPRVDFVYLKSLTNSLPAKTLALVYRPGQNVSAFPLPIDPAKVPPNRFSLPVSGVPKPNDLPTSSYRFVQRPSDHWLNREKIWLNPEEPNEANRIESHEEWIVSLDTGGLDELWNQALAQYNRSLRTVRPVNRITLLPHIETVSRDPDPQVSHVPYPEVDLPAEQSFTLSAEFVVRRKLNTSNPKIAQLSDLTIAPFRLKPLGTLQAILRFDLGDTNGLDRNAVSSSPQSLFYRANLTPNSQSSSSARLQDFSLQFEARLQQQTKLVSSTVSQVRVRIGSLDLSVGGAPSTAADSLIQSFQIEQITGYWNKVPRLVGDMWLPVGDVQPGGQDGLPSSEYEPEGYDATPSNSEFCIEQRFTGASPVVVPINPPTPDGSFLLKAHEENPTIYSETVSLQLRYVPPAVVKPRSSAAVNERVVVIDSDPFLVAAVDYPPLAAAVDTNTNIVALWNTGALDGQSWQLQTNAKPFELLLPPQGIGEEMPKAFELHLANGDPSDSVPPNSGQETDSDVLSPLDFRLSPAARQRLSASYTPQNFADAPWNLRRILGYPGQRDAGAGVVELNYELLYGLSCSVNTPLLRLAEIMSLIGRIPGRVPLLTIPDQSTSPTLSVQDQKVAYEKKRWNWSRFAELYSKRVAILEPRTSGSNYGTTVGAEGASTPQEEFTLSEGVACTFRGSSDLYYSVNPTDIAKVDDDTFPVSPQPTIALKGGVSWPFESPRLFHATVRNPKSSSAIVTGLALSPLGGSGTVKAGFDKDLSTITSITEIGRTSKVSVARLGRIGVFHNLARYVIEYERDTSVSKQFNGKQTPFEHRPVLRKVREFVEILEPVAELSTTSQTYPGGGCVKSIEFKQRIIPVTSAWSSNVGSNGWKIPLWFEPDSHANNAGLFVYTLPEVVLNLAGADGGDVECAIQSVDKLYFYSETDANADSDPHNWPIVPAVDFLPAPMPSPNPAFPTATVHEIPAYDPPTPFGLAAFTLQLAPGHGRANLVNGRSPQAIGANLNSVTLQRGPQSIPSTQNVLQQLHDKVRDTLYRAVRQDPKNLNDPAQAVCDAANAATAGVISQFNSLANGVVQRETDLLQGYLNQASSTVDVFVDELKAQLHTRSNLLQKKLSDVKGEIEGYVNTEVDAFTQRLGGVPASANAMQKFFARVCTSVKGAKGDLDSRKAALKAALNNVQVAANHDAATIESSLADIRSQLTDPINQVKLLLTQVRTQVQGASESWMPGVMFVSQQWEPTIFGALSQSEAIISQTETALAYANAGIDKQAADAVSALATTLSSAIKVVDSIAFPQILIDASVQAQQDAAVLSNYVSSLPVSVKGQLDGWLDTVGKLLAGGVITSTQDLDTIADSIAQQIRGLFDIGGDAIKTTKAAVLSNANTVTGNLKGYGSDFTHEVCSAVKALQNAAQNELETMRRSLEEAAGRLAESLAQALPVDDIQLPSGASVPALLNRAFGSTPSIQNLGFSLPNAAYFFGQLVPNVNLTPVLTAVKSLVPNLSPLSTQVPSFSLSDRALPVPHLPSFDLNNIFPDFAGLKLSNLFPALKMPAGSSDAVKVTHGLDTQSKTAWVQADIDLKTDNAMIFSLGPMALQIVSPRFTSTVRAQAGSNGQVSKQASGAITGDWQLLIGGSPMITLVSTSITFDNGGKLHVNVSPDRVQLSAALSFVQQIIALYSAPGSGFGIYPSATGIETRLALPIPDTSMGTTGITNLTFNFLFGLKWVPDFLIYAGFGLASPNAPFNLSVFILGGGGYLNATADYTPGKSLTCVVDMALDASAALSIALGPISGSVHVNLGMRFAFNSGKGDLSLGIFLLIGGEVNILGIVSANILLRLDATYENGSFTCRGLFSIQIKICWCFTLSVSEEVSCHLGSGGGLAYNEIPSFFGGRSDTMPLMLDATSISTVPSQKELDTYPALAEQYMQLIS